MKTVIIDNYDSFTYNLVHAIRGLGAETDVVSNDKIDLDAIGAYDKIILSPGPGLPSEAGLLEDTIRRYCRTRHILGVCLGHQAIAEVFGARLRNLETVFHGVSTTGIITAGDPILNGLPDKIAMGRYHSWVVDKETMPECLETTIMSEEGHIMALRHKEYEVHGLQFHPESILTPCGTRILDNFLKL